MVNAVIVDAVRTPGGRRNGKLKDWHPADLGAHVLKAIEERNGLDPALVDDVIMGCVMQVGEQSLNIGRNAVLAAAFINFMHLSAQEIRNLDPNHMITTGMISTQHAWLKNSPLEYRLYDTDLFDFLTVHCYNEEYHYDDSGLAKALGKPYIIEEAGFGNKYGGDRSGMVVRDMDRWFGGDAPARGYMPWGFMATAHDMGDGDGDSGMDRSLHSDWDALFRVYSERANALGSHRPEISVSPLRPPKTASFSVGTTVYAQTMVNVRHTPGYVNKPEADVVLTLELGEAATITGEAEARDGLIWWPIQIALPTGENAQAWAAESIPGQLLISAATPPLGMPMGPSAMEAQG